MEEMSDDLKTYHNADVDNESMEECEDIKIDILELEKNVQFNQTEDSQADVRLGVKEEPKEKVEGSHIFKSKKKVY